ncbi:hypothetical protein AAVH_23217, partial [Aphelenchoides avenae]
KLEVESCQGTRQTDDDLLYLRGQGTQTIFISSIAENTTRLMTDTLSPAGVIRFCFHGADTRRSFITYGGHTLAYRLNPSFIEELVRVRTT